MSEPNLIPLKDLQQSPRENPMIWDGEEAAQGVFLDAGADTDPLALLGTPSLQLPVQPRLPIDFEPGPLLRARLDSLHGASHAAAAGNRIPQRVELSDLDEQSLQAVLEMLGEGEVSGEVTLDDVNYRIRESVLTGIWRMSGSDGSDWLEVAPVPAVIQQAADSLQAAPVQLPPASPGIMNGLAVLAEINEHATAWSNDTATNRVLNFTLLPMNEEDQQLLIAILGRADLVLESGGFGNCRVMATRIRHVWAVQYVNAMGHTILDTIEVGHIPDAAVAASQDLEDSAARLDEILETYLA